MRTAAAAGAPEPDRWVPGDASVVNTTEFLMSRIALEDIIEYTAMGAFVGVAGTGKTFTFRVLVEELEDVRVVWLEFEHEPTDLHMAQVLAEKLIGERLSGRRYDISARILDVLQEYGDDKRLLVVIDEAQRLTTKNFEYLRYLHDHAQSGFSLALLGGNNAWQKIDSEPMLESRIFRRVRFKRMTPDVVVKTIPNYHPMYEDMSEDLIGRIDLYCDGLFRRWAQVTTSILKMHERRNKKLVDPELAVIAAKLVADNDHEKVEWMEPMTD